VVDPSDSPAGTNGGPPELNLEYPCPWTYTVIGTDEDRVRTAVAGVMGEMAHELRFSHSSKTGKYRSYNLELEVRSEQERLRIYRELHDHSDITYTL
jgi:putative lipoic acid-binding regulatory protein